MTDQRSKTAMVLAGGGIMGAAYEIGCLAALDRLFCPGFSTRRFIATLVLVLALLSPR